MEHETVTLRDQEVFASGTHNGDPYTDADLDQMIRAAGEVGFGIPLKLGHMSDDDTDRLLKAEGLPAFGWVQNLRRIGDKLVADFIDVPRRLAAIIRRKAYKTVSAEIFWNYKNAKGVWPRALKAIALLGGEIPAVTSLKDLEALYHSARLADGCHVYQTAYAGQSYETRVYQGRIVPVGDVDDLLDADFLDAARDDEIPEDAFQYVGATVPRQEPPMRTSKQWTPTPETAGAELARRVRVYHLEHPTLSPAAVRDILLGADPELKAMYALSGMGWTSEKPAPSVVVGPGANRLPESPSVVDKRGKNRAPETDPAVTASVGGGGVKGRHDWQLAGNILSERAHARMAANAGMSFETAFSLELAADTSLKIRYERRT